MYIPYAISTPMKTSQGMWLSDICKKKCASMPYKYWSSEDDRAIFRVGFFSVAWNFKHALVFWQNVEASFTFQNIYDSIKDGVVPFIQ
jgi:hypothetical protein